MAISIGGGITIGGGISVAIAPPTITITSQPTGQSVFSGASASFSVSASVTQSASLSYQWQIQQGGIGDWNNILGATSSTYTINNVTVANDNGDNFRAVVSATGGATPVTSNSVSLTVTAAQITIADQPTNQSSYPTGTATFSVYAVVTASATLSYQWQIQQGGTGGWSNITSATSSSYTTGTLTVADDNGDNYRVVVSATKEASPVTSNSATLTVTAAVITIDSQPTAQSASAGATATFSVSASATQSATLSYQWELQAGGSGSYSTISGATSSSYTTGTLSSGDNNNNYRVVVSGNRGASSVTSDAASLTVIAGITNTMLIGNDGYYYGASTSVGTFGSISSEYFYQIYVYDVNDGNTPARMNIFLVDGTYSGFTVTYGAIGSDTVSYPRVFSINNSNYTFVFDPTGGQAKYIYYGTLNFPSLIGQTIPIEYDGNSPSLTTNSIIGGSWSGYGMSYFGASIGLSPSGTNNNPVFGTVVSDYLSQFFYDLTNTRIVLKNGTYTVPGAGSFTVTSGWIDSDTSGSQRVFTIGGVNYSFSASGSGSNKQYNYVGNAGNLVSNVGSTVTFVYDPDAQGGGANMVNGTITVGNNGVVWGWSPLQYGSGNLIPAMVNRITGSSSGTEVWFVNGTYYGGIVVDDTTATVDGQTEVTITIDGITEIGTLATTGSTGPKASFAGDIFSLQSKNGQTLTVEMDSGNGGGGGGGTYTSGVDYGNGVSGPPGAYFSGPSGGTSFVFILNSGYWSNPAGSNALLALSSGGTFTVTMPSTGPTSFTITIAAPWNVISPTNADVDVTTSAPLSFSPGSQQVPSTITLGGGGGGGTVVTTYDGFWYNTDLFILVLASNTAGLAAMDAVAANATVTITDTTSSPTTVNLTLVGSFSKSGPSGPPGNEFYQYIATTSSSNPNSSPPPSGQYQIITSITVPSGGGGGGVISGTITNTYSPFGPGYYGGGGPGGPSTISVTPAAVDGIIYSAGSNSSTIVFMPNGTYGDVVLSPSGINGSTSITVTVGGVSVPLTVSDSGGGQLFGSASGDVWNLVSRVGQSLSVSISV